MEEFRFHMSLTGRLNEARRRPVLDMLRTKFAQLRLDALPIDRLALFRQVAGDTRFGIIGSWQLQSHRSDAGDLLSPPKYHRRP